MPKSTNEAPEFSQGVETREELGKWLRLHLTSQVGSITFSKLLKELGGIDEALGATAGQLSAVSGIGRRKAEIIAGSRDKVEVEAELDLAEQLGVTIITMRSDRYPAPLRELVDAPPVLYVKGEWTRQDALAVAVVGSRSCSQYGQEQASRFGHMLGAAGFTIVSGLARGIDSAAHRGALAGDGRTIAVQGCGLAQVYPPENADLAERIAANGAVISELPLKFEPLATTFPMRNRIIAGLALATIVVEARANSGALITARLAVEQNREVMAVPGRVDAPGSFGPHQLIKEGAKLVEKIEDVLDELGTVGSILEEHVGEIAEKVQQKVEPTLFDRGQLKLSEPESAVAGCLDHEPAHADEVIMRTELPAGQVNAALVSLQLKGVIKQLPGSFYQKR